MAARSKFWQATAKAEEFRGVREVVVEFGRREQRSEWSASKESGALALRVAAARGSESATSGAGSKANSIFGSALPLVFSDRFASSAFLAACFWRFVRK